MAYYHSSSHVSGLCWLRRGSIHFQQLPLQNVRIDATLYDLCAEVKIQQTYINNLHLFNDCGLSFNHDQLPSSHLECIYIFPLDEESAVFSFDAELDGLIVKGGIHEKSEARAEYHAAITSNRSAMLLEQSSDNIFQCKVGNLKYGSVCTITLTYLTLLGQEGRHNRFTLPIIVAPKYTPLNPGPTPPFPLTETAPLNTIHKGYQCHNCLCSPIIGTRHHCDKCAFDLCHGCYAQHDMGHPLHTHTEQSSPSFARPTTTTQTTVHSKIGDLIIKLNITMPSPILSIQCPSHPSETKITHSSEPSSHAVVFFHSVSTCSLAKDFILLVEQQRCFEPRVLCELDVAKHTAAVSLAFIPPPVDMLSASQIQCELVFLIDCSGSMSSSSITCVRECMQLLLRSLPVHCYFNIVIFGSTWSSLFSSSQPYDDTSLSAASHHISGLGANLGGTEIYPPLLHVLTSKALPTHPRQVFLLTDGQVSNLKQLVQLTTQRAVSTRLFTFGIGSAVDRLLCKKLAQAGRGKCEFVTAEDGGGSAMREKVVRQVARAMQPVLTNVNVDWGQLKQPMCQGDHEKERSVMSTEMDIPGSSISNTSFLQCPSVAPAIFMSSRYMLHALNVSLPDYVWQQAKEGHTADFKCEISISALSNHPLEKEHMHHSVVLTGEQITLAGVIHTLAAKERIRELEDKVPACSGDERKKLEDEVLLLATKYTLSSSRTSFVIVYNAGTDQEASEEMALSFKAEDKDGMPTPGRHALTSFARGAAGMSRRKKAYLCKQALPSDGALNFSRAKSLSVQNKSDEEEEPLFSVAQPSSYKKASALFTWAQSEKEKASAPFAGALFGSSKKESDMSAPYVDVHADLAAASRGQSLSPSFMARVQGGADANQLFCSTVLEKAGKRDQKSNAFEELIMLQSANGSWQMTPALIDVTRIIAHTDSIVPTLTIQSLQTIGKVYGVDDMAVAVLLALQLLEIHFKHRHAEWEMLATKALFFLNGNCRVSSNTQQKIKDSIAKLLGM